MTAEAVFTAVYEDVENGWVQARIAEIPGVVTAAPTRDEATEMLLDAFAEYVRSYASGVTTPPSGTQVTVTFATG